MKIKTDTQLEVTRYWRDRFQKSAEQITGDDILSKAQREGCQSIADELDQKIEEYLQQ